MPVSSVTLLFIARSTIYLVISVRYAPLVSTSIIMFLRGRLNVGWMYNFFVAASLPNFVTFFLIFTGHLPAL